MKRYLIIGLAGFMALGGVALAQRPEPPPDRPGPRPEGRPGRFMDELGLSDQQKTQLRALRSEQHKAGIRRRADLQIARMELQELIEAPTVDDKAIAAKVKQLADLQAAALKARVDSRLALRKVLTPEQLEKMKQMRPERRMERRHQFRRPMRPPGGGEGPGDEPPGEEDDEV